MPGFDHNFTKFDERMPYEIRQLSAAACGSSFNKSKFAIFKKGDDKPIYELERGFGRYGQSAFYQFMHQGTWYAFVGPQYNDAILLNLETGEIVARLDKEKTGGDFCPTNFYVPSVNINTEKPVYHSEEYRIKIKRNANGKFIGQCGDKNPEYADYDGEEKIIPAADHYMSLCDYEQSDPEEDIDIDPKFDIWIDWAFVAGVWWAADYEWLIYRINIPDAIKTGKFAPETNHCFEFYYGAVPELRQYMKMEDPDVDSNHPFKTNYGSFHFYTQKFTDYAFEEKEKKE